MFHEGIHMFVDFICVLVERKQANKRTNSLMCCDLIHIIADIIDLDCF